MRLISLVTLLDRPPKLVCDNKATRGSWPSSLALAADCIAKSASCSEVGCSCTKVSAIKTVRCCAETIVSPKICWSFSISIARAKSFQQVGEFLVRPVTIASASPEATMQAAKMFRSLFTMRWQSRYKNPFRCRRL